MYLLKQIKPNFSIEQILVSAFGMFILGGGILLLVPFSTNGNGVSVIDALFTATSATCVTGLVVVDTGTQFTLLGQTLILIMIQLGGLGIITFSVAFLYLLDRRLSLGSRDVLFETLTQGPIPDIKKLLKTVFFSTFIIEAIGALVLTIRFVHDMPLHTAVYSAVFHSISAFCNAGFSLYANSLSAYQNDLVVNMTITGLIILGGFGFLVIYEYNKLQTFKFSFHSKLVFKMSALLILFGTVMFFIIEYSNVLKDLPFGSKILTSFFHSVSARTAGFNTVHVGLLSNPTLFILVLLMFVGAAPASCGGGIKVTTAAILMAHFRARFKNQENVNLLLRRVPQETVSKAISIFFFSIVVILLFTMLLLITELGGVSHQESRGMFLELLFEVTSAFATVGLSAGVTATLSPIGKFLIICVMFIGRLGPLTIAMSVGRKSKDDFKYAQEKVLVG